MAQLNVVRTPQGKTTAKGLHLQEVGTSHGGGVWQTYRQVNVEGGLAPGVSMQKVNYRVELDVLKLHAMARKAAGSKGGRAQDGPVVVTVVEG